METQDASTTIVKYLLNAAMDQAGFEELERQPGYVPSFLNPSLRKKVYPFERGLNPSSNLVTLLCWADYLKVAPDDRNRYFEAKMTDEVAFTSVERDRSRHTVTFRPFILGRVVTYGALVAAITYCVIELVPDWHRLNFSRNWFISILLYLIPPVLDAILAGLVAIAVTNGIRYRSQNPLLRLAFSEVYFERPVSNSLVGRIDSAVVGTQNGGRYYWDIDTLTLCAASVIITIPYVVSVRLLLGAEPWALYLVTSVVVIWLVYWLTATDIFAKSSVLYLRKTNSYVDMYEDPRSRHWVTATLATP
jgi:hypothetical protein